MESTMVSERQTKTVDWSLASFLSFPSFAR